MTDFLMRLIQQQERADRLKNAGRLEAAEQLQRITVQELARTVGHQHPLTLRAMLRHCHILNAQGAYERAKEILRDLVGECHKILGASHADTCEAAATLLGVLVHTGDHRAALQIRREYLDWLLSSDTSRLDEAQQRLQSKLKSFLGSG